MQNGIVPIPLIPEPAGSNESSEIDFGYCTGCGQGLKESKFAIGNICDSCLPAFEASWKARQQNQDDEAAERLMFPKRSNDDWKEMERWRSN